MKLSQFAATALCALLLSGCGLFKEKAADFYLGRARKTAELQAPAEAEVKAAFASIEKALDYAPGSPQAVDLLGRLSDAAAKGGFPGAQELEASALKKALAGSPLNWAARAALTGFFAARGDTGGLEAMAAQAAELAASGDPGVKYCALLAGLYARASALPWLESEAYLAMNKSPEILFEKAAAYGAAAAKALELKGGLERLAFGPVDVKRYAPAGLSSAAEVAMSDAMGDIRVYAAINNFNQRAAANQAFRKSVELTVQGNVALVKKEYAQARAFYQGALNHYPVLLDARRQLAETDFQDGAALAAVGGNPRAAAQLLYKALAGVTAVLQQPEGFGNQIPFIKPQRFLGETWALKAAVLAALRATEGARLKNAAKQEAEFKAALDEALKLNPEGRLARELLERYTKEGF
ncbi:MAG: hypothetical protein A2X32_00370 [Elusimicrobia bacterium GWC2_64_44]|nr:MAG: hypothetical protein A2X32_00370 [Elusimicrobia bacterium GWC2_64_44]